MKKRFKKIDVIMITWLLLLNVFSIFDFFLPKEFAPEVSRWIYYSNCFFMFVVYGVYWFLLRKNNKKEDEYPHQQTHPHD